MWHVVGLFLLGFCLCARANLEIGGRYVDKTNGEFTVESELGSGGNGIVYRAMDAATRTPFALKLFYDGANAKKSEGALALIATALDRSPVAHRFLPIQTVSYKGVGRGPAVWQPAQRMPVVLADLSRVTPTLRLTENRLSGDEMSRRIALLLTFFDPMIEAWGALDHRQVIHRDLSLRNFFVDGPKTFLADFDLAESLKSEGVFTALGNPQTMAPEMWRAKKFSDVGTESDFFSLAATFFEMLTGRTIWANAGFATINARTVPLLIARGDYAEVFTAANATLASVLRVYRSRVVRDWALKERLEARLFEYMNAILIGLQEAPAVRARGMGENSLIRRVRARVKPTPWLKHYFCGTALTE